MCIRHSDCKTCWLTWVIAMGLCSEIMEGMWRPNRFSWIYPCAVLYTQMLTIPNAVTMHHIYGMSLCSSRMCGARHNGVYCSPVVAATQQPVPVSKIRVTLQSSIHVNEFMNHAGTNTLLHQSNALAIVDKSTARDVSIILMIIHQVYLLAYQNTHDS